MAWEYAEELGVMTPEQAGEARRAFGTRNGDSATYSAASTSSPFTSGCGSAENNTGNVYGCYERFRGANYHYSTASYATGKAEGLGGLLE